MHSKVPRPALPRLNLLESCQNLEIWYVYTHPYVVLENIPYSLKALIIVLLSSFFCKKTTFLSKIVLLLKAIV